jgi:hypothetical protein
MQVAFRSGISFTRDLPVRLHRRSSIGASGTPGVTWIKLRAVTRAESAQIASKPISADLVRA